MTTGLLAPGIVEIVGLRAEEPVLGYAHTEETETGQLTRWLLFQRPENAFRIRAAPESMAAWTLSDWQENVPRLWQPGCYYVLAYSDLYRYGETYASGAHDWTSIPSFTELPKLNWPPSCPEGFQLDPEGGLVLRQLDSSINPGLAYTVRGLLDSSNIEYWMLPSGYVPAGGSASVEVTAATTEVPDAASFIALANQSWGPGCVFAITGCYNYAGKEAPKGV